MKISLESTEKDLTQKNNSFKSGIADSIINVEYDERVTVVLHTFCLKAYMVFPSWSISDCLSLL